MRETPIPDKADRKRPVEVRFLANGAGLEMIKIGCQSPARISSVPTFVIRGYLRRMARGALAKIQKWTSMRTRILGNFRVPPRGSAADLSEIVPGALPAGRYRSGAALRVAFPWISGEKQNRHDRDHACSGKMECYCLTGGAALWAAFFRFPPPSAG